MKIGFLLLLHDVAHGEYPLCRVPDKMHTTKVLVHGKHRVSGSVPTVIEFLENKNKEKWFGVRVRGDEDILFFYVHYYRKGMLSPLATIFIQPELPLWDKCAKRFIRCVN